MVEIGKMMDRNTVDKLIQPQPFDGQVLKSIDQHLRAGEELRILNIKDHIRVQLISGLAEVFGAELPPVEPTFFHAG